MFLCPCPHGPVSPSVCLLPCVPVSPMSQCPCPFVPTLISPSLCFHVPISPSLCPHVPVSPSPCPHLHVPVPVSLSPCPHVPMSFSLCPHVPVLMSLCLQVPMSPCPFVPVPVSPYHPGLPVLSRELPSEGPHGLCRVGAGTRDRTCSPFFPDGRLIPSLSPQLRSLTPSPHRRPAMLPLQTLQAAPPRLGGTRKAQRCIFTSSRTVLPHLVALSVQVRLGVQKCSCQLHGASDFVTVHRFGEPGLVSTTTCSAPFTPQSCQQQG